MTRALKPKILKPDSNAQHKSIVCYTAPHVILTLPDLDDIQKLTTFRSIISHLSARAKATGEICRPQAERSGSQRFCILDILETSLSEAAPLPFLMSDWSNCTIKTHLQQVKIC